MGDSVVDIGSEYARFFSVRRRRPPGIRPFSVMNGEGVFNHSIPFVMALEAKINDDILRQQRAPEVTPEDIKKAMIEFVIKNFAQKDEDSSPPPPQPPSEPDDADADE